MISPSVFESVEKNSEEFHSAGIESDSFVPGTFRVKPLSTRKG